MKRPMTALAVLLCIFLIAACAPAQGAEEAAAPTPLASATAAPTEEPLFRGDALSADTVELSLRGDVLSDEDMEALLAALPRLTKLETVDLTGASLRWRYVEELQKTVHVIYDFPLYGKVVSTGAETLDLQGCEINDEGAALEDAIAVMPALTWVDISGCGLNNGECSDLNEKYENIRIVWTVRIGGYAVRTDATAFTPMKDFQGGVNDKEARKFRYCTDMIALDLGHQSVSELDFLYSMPHLKYLVLSDSSVHDITPVGSLKELEFLEMFLVSVEDLSPLLGCEELRELNYCYPGTYCGKSAMEVLPQLQTLERLFFCGSGLSEEQKSLLRGELPSEAEIILSDGPESTGIDWRYGHRYYEMRDLLDMYYMLAEKPRPTAEPTPAG